MSPAVLVIPSLGAPSLAGCLAAVGRLDPPPLATVLVLSGDAEPPPLSTGIELVRHPRRLGFAAAVNAGITAAPAGADVALLNDDAEPDPAWLATLAAALADEPDRAAVQGTVADAAGERVDGRGIALDRWGLAVQRDRGAPVKPEPAAPRPVLAASATAVLLRRAALVAAALPDGRVLDEHLDSYHEDLDLGLRLARLGFTAAWVPEASCRHLGSTSGLGHRWLHPWWLLANRWRVLAANLAPTVLLTALPRLLRGEVRAVRTLTRGNPRAPLAATAVAAQLPRLVVWGWRRPSAGARLSRLPAGAP